MDNITDMVSVRQIELTDLPFILDSSVACLTKYTESFVKGYSPEYAKFHIENIVKSVLNDTDYSCFICSHKDNSNAIIGYLISNPHINHIFFQYTKYAYRKLGLQKTLLLPLLVDKESRITVQWPTKEMLKLQKQGRIYIENRILDKFLEENR